MFIREALLFYFIFLNLTQQCHNVNRVRTKGRHASVLNMSSGSRWPLTHSSAETWGHAVLVRVFGQKSESGLTSDTKACEELTVQVSRPRCSWRRLIGHTVCDVGTAGVSDLSSSPLRGRHIIYSSSRAVCWVRLLRGLGQITWTLNKCIKLTMSWK